MIDHRLRSLLVLPLALALGSTLGCSVYMAAKQPPRKDLAVLHVGTPRALVIAELGQPVATTESDGVRHDFFVFRQGYSTGARATRAVFHATADVFTLGLWEVVGTPAEAIFDGTDVKLEVVYDARDVVTLVRAHSGADAVSEVPTVVPGAGAASNPAATGASAASPATQTLASAAVAAPAVVAETSARGPEAVRDYRRRLNED
jgi:hypothetical protein